MTVDCGNGRSFQYWHVDAVARAGQQAVAGKTLLGYVQLKREHVHLTQLEDGRAVNPLAPNRLTPYRDPTTPRVLSVSTRSTEDRLILKAQAIDMPSVPVPGRWRSFPIAPALVTWRIEDAFSHVVVPTRIARDVRRTVPVNDRFWDTYARGTHQNWPVFDGRKQRGMTGRYVFKLSTRPIDTSALAWDVRARRLAGRGPSGNRSSRARAFSLDGV